MLPVDVVSWLWLLYPFVYLCVFAACETGTAVFPAHMTQTLPSRARRVIRNVSLSFAFFVAVHPNI